MVLQGTSLDVPADCSVTQCGIPPGKNFTYNFTLNQVGTYWYHSQYVHLRDFADGGLSTQYTDGLFGPIVIHDPKAANTEGVLALGKGYDEERILFLGDWYHTYSSVLLQQYMGNNGNGESDNRSQSILVSTGSWNGTASRYFINQWEEHIQLFSYTRIAPANDGNTTELHRWRIIQSQRSIWVNLSSSID
jgi:FtsP/CotA-like multicopper oxidase with cupredoxin domain